MEKKNISFRKILTIIAVCLAIFRLGVGAYRFWDGMISKRIVRIAYDETEAWKELEKGALFVSAFQNSGFAEECEVLEIRYADNRWQEKYRQGKLPDVYVLELDPGDQMEAIRERIIQSDQYCGGRMLPGDPPAVVQDAKRVNYYEMDQLTGSDTDRFLFLVGYDFDYLRFVLKGFHRLRENLFL